METETDIMESLNAIGYRGKFSQEDILAEAISEGPKSEDFRELITWICYELHVLRNTDEKIGKDNGFNEFMLELSAFLKELGCPYIDIVAGPLSGRIQTKESRILLLDYLLTELMSSKMCIDLKPEEDSYIIPVFETPTASALQTITKELNLGKPPENIATRTLFDKITNKIDNVVKQINPKLLSKPLFQTSQNLTDVQWEKLEKLQKEFDDEYNKRRLMLLTRLDVTVDSFEWSEKMKSRTDELMNKYHERKKEVEKYSKGDTCTDIAALLAARADLAIIEKTSSSRVRKNTTSKIQKHVIGKVPDRGGRAYEHAPPPPEMPSWQQNRSIGPAQGSGGGRGGGGNVNRGGGRGGGSSNQGNWNQQNQGQFGQRPQYEQRQQYDQRQQVGQQMQQYQSFGQRQENQWQGSSGGGRVQGGWSQRGNEKPFNQVSGSDSGFYGAGGGGIGGGNNFYSNQGSNYRHPNQGYGGTGANYGNDNRNASYRGRLNYNRGGGAGGGRR